MERPLTLSTHQIELSPSVKNLIEERAERLEHFYPRLVGCSVIVEGPGGHHRTGGPYNVRIDLRVPDAEPIVVSRQKAEELEIAIRESFDAAKRRLEDFARLQRGDVKAHEPPATGCVVRVFAEEGYGFIRTDEIPSREVYFHRNSLVDFDFQDLTVGAAVRYHPEAGVQGPQASSVTMVEPEPQEPPRTPALERAGERPGEAPRAPHRTLLTKKPRERTPPMKIRDLMTRNPTTCTPEDSAATALAHMWEDDCGIVPVIDGDRLVGVVTDRDLAMALLFQGSTPADLRLSALDLGAVHLCHAEDDVPEALEVMAEHRVRRLPVLENGRLAGIVSLNDVALEARATNGDFEGPTYGDVAKALQSICGHHKLPMPA